MELKGKLISGWMKLHNNTGNARIQLSIEDLVKQLPPIRNNDIKKGDIVWVRRKVLSIGKEIPELIITDDNETDIIAHFPTEPKPQPKKSLKSL